MGKGRNRTYLSVVFAIVIAIVFSCFPHARYSVSANKTAGDSLVLHYIDVGQGDSTFIELPNGKTILIDAGELEYGERVVKYIKKLGYTKIDCLIATHSDSDHVGGLSAVLDAFEVNFILRPFVVAGMFNDTNDDLSALGLPIGSVLYDNNEAYVEFINKAYKETCNGDKSIIETLSNKTIIEAFFATSEPYFMIEVLYPFAIEGTNFVTPSGLTTGYMLKFSEDSNAISSVISLTSEKHKVLLMSDASDEIENSIIELANSDELIKERLANLDVLKISHHGSATATTSDFLKLTNPHYAVISVGEDNDYGHPSDDVLRRLNDAGVENIYRTDKHGNIAIELCVNGDIKTNAKERKEFSIPDWLLYVLFSVIIVAVVAITIVYSVIKKRKNDEDFIKKSSKSDKNQS